MPVQIYSFSALLDIDCNNSIANLTILKNTFPSTSTPYMVANITQPQLYFDGYLVDVTNCVFNTNFGYSLVDRAGAGYNETGIIVPRVSNSGADTIIGFFGYKPNPTDSLTALPFLTLAPYFFNFKEYKNV